MTPVGGRILFVGRDALGGYELWSLGGRPPAASQVYDIVVRGLTGNDRVGDVIGLGGRVLFHADDGVNGTELWSSDGTPAGTRLVRDIKPGKASSNPVWFARLRDRVLFRGEDDKYGAELWITDGSPTGTGLLKDITPGPIGSGPAELTVVGDLVYFVVTESAGNVVWVTDGTAAGTRRLVSPATGPLANSPGYFTGFHGMCYFMGWTNASGYELWRTDGTAAGTTLVADIEPGSGSSWPSELTVLGDRLYFEATSAANGRELWVSDGTTNGTRLAVDIEPGTGSSSPGYLCVQGGRLWFRAQAGGKGPGLWSSDGTAKGTSPVAPVGFDRNPAYLTPVGSRRLYFSADTAFNGRELCRVDVTGNPLTVEILDIEPGSIGSSAETGWGTRFFAIAGGRVWGTAYHLEENRLFYAANGATAQPIDPPLASTSLAATDPLLNATMTVTMATGLARPVQLLLTGEPATSVVPAFGGWLYVDLLRPVHLLGASTFPKATIPIAMPNDSRLVGVRVVLQTLALDLTNPAQVEPGNAVDLWIDTAR
ncbi:MAG: hypothetical protein R3F30_06535 [Planctomycetota bacterium]